MSTSKSRATAAVRAHAADVLAYLTRRVDSPEDAADLLSEVLLIVWKRITALPSDDSEVRPWMFGIARKVLLRHHRTMQRKHAVADRLRSMLTVAESPGFSDRDDHADLRDALIRLEQVDRDIIGLVHWEGFSLKDVGRIMRMKEGTVRSRYHRARASLRTYLAERPEGTTSPNDEPTAAAAVVEDRSRQDLVDS